MAHVPDATRPDPGALCLFLLGSFRLAHGGRTVHFPMRNVESLLAFLALRLEAYSRTRLAALCWGDFGDEQACLSLRVALSTLRKDRVRLLPEFRPESEGGSTSGSGGTEKRASAIRMQARDQCQLPYPARAFASRALF